MAKLSPREVQVARRLAVGENSEQIGAVLGISPRTVDKHRSSIRSKLDLWSEAEIATWVMENLNEGPMEPKVGGVSKEEVAALRKVARAAHAVARACSSGYPELAGQTEELRVRLEELDRVKKMERTRG